MLTVEKGKCETFGSEVTLILRKCYKIFLGNQNVIVLYQSKWRLVVVGQMTLGPKSDSEWT